MSGILLAAAVGVWMLTNWLWNRPHRREQGTQHIAMVGYTLAALLFGAAVGGWLF
jgi:hypothetical protein